jgi:glycosyltransferase involved in cell wall biosynthesis
MKIIYLVHQFYPEHYTGTEKFLLNISSMMQKIGYDVKVFTYSFYNDSYFDKYSNGIMYKEFLYKGIPIIAFKHKEIPLDIHITLQNIYPQELLKEIMQVEKPDILHVGHPMRMTDFIKIAIKLDIPYVITLTDFWLMCPKYILFNSINQLCEGPENGQNCKKYCPEFSSIEERLEMCRYILFNAKKVYSLSLFVATMFKKEYADLNIKIINHGISYDKIKISKNNYSKDNQIIFCYAGTLAPHKGVHIILDAFKKINSNKIQLKIYGSGHNESYVNQLKKIAKNDRRIQFCGVFSENEVGEIFSKVDLVIVPSLWYENYPLVLHEALACNVPVIASNVGGMAEKISDGKNGFTFEIGNSNSLKKIIEMIINNPDLLNQLKNNLKNFILPTVEQEAYAYEREYKSLV